MPIFEVPDDTPFLKPGIQVMEVVAAVDKVSKNGNEMIEITLESKGGAQVKDYLVFTTKAAFKLKEFLQAAGRKLKKGDKISLTYKECLEVDPLVVELAPDEENPKYMRVKRYLTPDQMPPDQIKDGDEIPF
jgi:hypothetical protein